MSTDNRYLDDDVRARRDALDVTRSFIVQAPAGSGKTELLIQRYLRLLPLVQNPEEILAITFTRKAALEMKLRVMKALQSARDKEEADSDHARQTLGLATAVLMRDEELGWNLIDAPDRMRIETVDAFGSGIARAVPFSSGLGGTGGTVADADLNALYRDAAAATLDYLTLDNGLADAIECVLSHLDNNVPLYVSYIAKMLASREQWLSITGAGFANDSESVAARQYLESNIEKLVSTQLEDLARRFPALHQEELVFLLRYAGENLVESGNSDHAAAVFAGCAALPRAHADERCSWQAISNLLLTKAGTWRKSATVRDGFPPRDDGQKQRLLDLITALRETESLRVALDRTKDLPNSAYTDAQWQVLTALFQLLPHTVGELRRIFGEQGVSDHTEVALAAGRALGRSDNPGDVALILDYQVKHLLVDEMQDTSFAQYELLGKLVEGWSPGDGRTLFCVGDPMQSIYRFRDAEVGEFLLARQKGVKGVPLESLLLRRNFRSGENLVHWFNTVFAQVMPIHDDVSAGAISYSESLPVTEQSGQGDYRVHPLFDADGEAEARHTVSVIKQCIEQAEGDVAVLVRSRTQLLSLLRRLRESAVEYQAIEIDRLTDLPEIIDLLALTRALCHEGDRLAWLAVLRGPWVGLRWRDLHAMVCNDSQRTIPELCEDAERRATLSEDGDARLQRFFEDIAPFRTRSTTVMLRERIERAWCALGGPALLDDTEQIENVYRFLAVLEKIEQAGTVADVGELERRLDDERVSNVAGAQCRVQIMTMHRAKGLQFDHVVLPGLGRATRGSDREVLNWLAVPSASGDKQVIVSPVGSRTEMENDPLHRFIEATESAKDKLELDRLLYVACTRAVKSLHLIGSVAVAKDGESFRPPHNGSLLARLWSALEPEYVRRFAEANVSDTQNETEDANDYLVAPELRRFAHRWDSPVPVLSDAANLKLDEVGRSEQKVEFYWVGSAARQVGTIVHRWLQRVCEGSLDISNRNAHDEEATTRRWALDSGVPNENLDDVWERTRIALDCAFSDPKGQWLLSGEGHAELALTGLYQGQPESVVIDRVKIDVDGTHWVVDYKTSTHEGGDLQRFLREESDRYRPQLRRYAEIYGALTGEEIKTALYFPVLQEFCEVSTEVD